MSTNGHTIPNGNSEHNQSSDPISRHAPDSVIQGPTRANETAPTDSLPPQAIDFAGRLFDAARKGDINLLQQVLDYNAGIKNLRNDRGDTLIMLAAYHGHSDLVKLLLEKGSDPNILNDRQQSPLAGAIFKGEVEVVNALLEGGADPRVGIPRARDAVRMFGQENVWGERMDRVIESLQGDR